MTAVASSAVLPAWVSTFRTPEEVNRPVADVEGRVPAGLAGRFTGSARQSWTSRTISSTGTGW